VLGRLAQFVQYGLAAHAVGGRFDVTSSAAAEGIQLVGTTAGDFVPGQLGALEAFYSAFAEALAFPDAQAAAISLVMLMRGALVAVSLIGLLLAALLPKAPAQSSSSPPPPPVLDQK
jgi:hypothetical protein